MKKIVSILLVIVILVLSTGCQTVNITRGTIDGNVYKNESLAIEFVKPATWVYATDEQIAELMEITADQFSDEKFVKALESQANVYDMMVTDPITSSNINVGYENLSLSHSRGITEAQYVEAMKNQFKDVTEMKITFPDSYDKVKLGETEFTRVVCTVTAYGVSMTQVYYLHKLGGYMSYIIVTITNKYSVDDIEAMFK